MVQEGMIGLFKAIRDYRAERMSRFRTFAELCVKRQMITAVKAATRHKHVPLNKCISLYLVGMEGCPGLPLESFSGGGVTDPERVAMDFEAVEFLYSEAWHKLSTFEAAALQYYMQGMTYKEIASLLSCGIKSIDNALQRAKRKIGRMGVS